MISVETLNNKIQMLPPSARKAVLDFIENLLERSGKKHPTAEDHEWSEFSLTNAMAGLEDETLYSEDDLQEKWH